MTQNITAHDLQSFRTSFVSAYSFCPFGIYCIATGKQIGVTNPDELDFFLQDDSRDMDEIVDDVAVRILASMRPSIHWNKMREETLDDMRRRSPVDTLAYLLNRLFAPREFKTSGFSFSNTGLFQDRIKLHQFLGTLDVESINKMLHMLIEIDAKHNLDSLAQPLSCKGFIEDDKRLETLSTFYAAQVEAYDKKVKADEMQNRWVKYGNPLASRAYSEVWKEIGPISVTKQKKIEKKKEDKFFADIFDELTLDSGSTEAPVIEAAKVKIPTVRLGKLKLNLAKKV